MIFSYDGNEYPIIINKKNNKNTYLRVDSNLNIIVNTNYFVSKGQIKKIIEDNYSDICKMINKQKKTLVKDESFFYLGRSYEIVYDTDYKHVVIINNKIYAKDFKMLDKWYKDEMLKLYSERLEYNYDLFEENIPFPKLRIRKMKTRWGVCNIKTKTITLNSLLFKETVEKLDYVIVHELSHLIYFNHSRDFWNLVSKYCLNYKQIRKSLKE